MLGPVRHDPHQIPRRPRVACRVADPSAGRATMPADLGPGRTSHQARAIPATCRREILSDGFARPLGGSAAAPNPCPPGPCLIEHLGPCRSRLFPHSISVMGPPVQSA